MHDDILEAIETTDRKMLYITSDKIIIVKLGGLASFLATKVLMPSFGDSDVYARKKEKLGKLSPETILTDDKKSFAIPYTEITRLEMSKRFLGGPKVKITVGVNKHQFTLKDTNEYFKCMSALKPVLEDKLTVS